MDKIYENQVDIKTQERNAIRNRQQHQIQNNFLDEANDEETEASGSSRLRNAAGSYFSLIRSLAISDLIQLVMLYARTLLSLYLMIVSILLTNLYQFLFRKEKCVVDQNVLITGSGGYFGNFEQYNSINNNKKLRHFFNKLKVGIWPFSLPSEVPIWYSGTAIEKPIKKPWTLLNWEAITRQRYSQLISAMKHSWKALPKVSGRNSVSSWVNQQFY